MLLLRPGYSPIRRCSLARNEIYLSILRLFINPNSENKRHHATGLHFRLTRAASTHLNPLTYIKCSVYNPIFHSFHLMECGQHGMAGSAILHIVNSQKIISILSMRIRRISVKAKARARDSKSEEENESEGGLSGRGIRERRKGRDRIDALGRLMTKILRHEAEKLKLNMRGDGYVPVNELLNLKIKTFTGVPLCSYNVADVKEAVKNDNKQRFSLLEENGQLLIRANQGHSIKVVDSEKLLKPILSASEVPVCVHGTYRKNLESIRRTGLKRMTRVHIHFATGLPHDGVISGMHSNCEILIFLDVQKALKDGMKLYLSDNNVLLTEGLNGIIPPSYFAKIETWPNRELIS